MPQVRFPFLAEPPKSHTHLALGALELPDQVAHSDFDRVSYLANLLGRLTLGILQFPVLERDSQGGACLLDRATHADYAHCLIGKILGEHRARRVGYLDADLGHSLHDLGMRVIGGLGARRPCSQSSVCESVEERFGHARATGVVNADKQDEWKAGGSAARLPEPHLLLGCDTSMHICSDIRMAR